METKNIDKLFKNKLAKHQVQPSNEAWDKLEEALYGKQIKRRSLVAYWQIAAAVALLLTASLFYFKGGENENQLSGNQLIPSEKAIKLQENKANQPIDNKKELAKAEEKIEEPIVNIPNKSQEISLTKADKKAVLKKNEITVKKETILVGEEAKNEALAKSEIPLLKEEKSLESATTTTTKPEEETIATANKPAQVEEKTSFTIVVKMDEATQEEEVGKKKGKKSWVGKMVSNIRKNRDKEREESGKEEEERPEKSTINLFGISADKIFAKKEHPVEPQKQTNE
jgi:hypothetical protein